LALTLPSPGVSSPADPGPETRAAAPLRPDALAVIAAGLSRAARPGPSAWRRSGDRRFARLLRTARYEAWLIEWSPSSGLDLHDHGGSVGSLHVAEGALVETYTDLAERRPIRSRRLPAGEGFPVPPTRVHEISNEGPDLALSVHVYSPPLGKMTFYDHRPASFLDVLHTASGSGVAGH
jgi:hypothetical protein